MSRQSPSLPRFGSSEGLAAVSVLAALAALLVLTDSGAWSVPSAANVPVDATVAVAYPLLGALIVRHGRGSRAVGTVLLAAGCASALTVLCEALASSATASTTTARLVAQAAGSLWVLGVLPLVTLLPLVFPDGLRPGRVWRGLAAATIAGLVLGTVAVALHPEDFAGRVTLPKVVTSEPVAVVLVPVAAVLVLAGAVGGLVALVVRLVRADRLVRRQIGALFAAAALFGLDLVLQPVLPPAAGIASQAVAAALVPVAIGVAVTRHRLYDFDLAVRRALAGASLVACLAGLYLAAFFLFSAAVGERTAVATGLAAGLTGLVVLPLGNRLVRGVDRLFYGDRADRYRVLTRFSARLREHLDIDEVPQALCDAVVGSLRLGSADLVVDGGRRASAGEQAGTPAEFALRHRGAVVGSLTVTPRPGQRALDDVDADLVAALADSAAPAVAALRLTDSLQDARERLVVAREEERRRVRRDLHDGVGAALAGLRLQLDSARDLVDDPLAAKLLDAAADGLTDAVRDVRQVTDDLRPPALDDLGLAASLEALAARVRTPSLDVPVSCGSLPVLPAAVDVACYRIAAEALTNAVKHAAASRIDIVLRAEDGELRLTVTDDGTGLQAASGDGIGMTSMRQRAEELGGRCTVESGPDGTRVAVVLPMEPV